MSLKKKIKYLVIFNVQESDSGSYTCEGVLDDGRRMVFQSHSELLVGGKD